MLILSLITTRRFGYLMFFCEILILNKDINAELRKELDNLRLGADT